MLTVAGNFCHSALAKQKTYWGWYGYRLVWPIIWGASMRVVNIMPKSAKLISEGAKLLLKEKNLSDVKVVKFLLILGAFVSEPS